jgi:hypothetical protein
MTIKVGDKVDWTNKTSRDRDRWQGCTVIGEEIFHGRPHLRVTSPVGSVGLLDRNEVALSPRKLTDYSDQELADEYRDLRRQARDVFKVLSDREFELQVKFADQKNWQKTSPEQVEFRFQKIETIQTVL